MSLNNENAKSDRVLLILALIFTICLFPTSMGYQIQIPNYQILRNKKILTQNFNLNANNLFSEKQFNSNAQQQQDILNKQQQVTITFQFLIYPYRVFSYFDETNKMQYIFQKVGFGQFDRSKKDNNNQMQSEKQKTILKNQFNVKKCLFEKLYKAQIDQLDEKLNKQGQLTNQIEQKIISNENCLSKYELYSFLPDLLMIVQQEHEQIKIQKINEQYLLIKNYANENSTHEVKYHLNLDIFRINLHSYIYEARLTFMQFLYEQKNFQKKKSDIEKEQYLQHKTDNSLQISKIQLQLPEVAISESDPSHTAVPEESSSEDSFYNVKVSDYFQNEYEIWNTLYSRNMAILSNLISFENNANVNKSTKFDYIASDNTFYVVKVQEITCPHSNHIQISLLFENTQKQTQKQSISHQQTCTLLTVHKTQFIQFQSPQPMEYITRQNMFKNIQSIVLGLTEKDKFKSNNKQFELCIQILTKQMIVEIWYGSNWKQVRAEYRQPQNKHSTSDNSLNLNKNEKQISPQSLSLISHVQNSQNSQESFEKVFFLQLLTKVWITNDKLTIYKIKSGHKHQFEKNCEFQLKPFVLTAQRINSKLFVACVQGSKCMILNQQCQVIQTKIFENAFGINWSYKLDFSKDKIKSYIQATKRSDSIQQMFKSPIDSNELEKPKLKSGTFLDKYQIIDRKNNIYSIQKHLIIAQVHYEKKQQWIQLNPSILKQTVPYYFNPQEIYPDNVYASSIVFKEKNLDNILHPYLKQKFESFYFPNEFQYKNNSLQLLDFYQENQFQQFFNGCKYQQKNSTVYFKDNWNGCKVTFKTNSLLVIDSFLAENNNIQLQNPTNQSVQKVDGQTEKQQFIDPPNLQQKSSIQLHKSGYFVQIFANGNIQNKLNTMIVCSMHKNGPPYSKCKVSEYQITSQFYEGHRKVKFFLDGSKHFQIYFFNKKFQSQSKNSSFLETLADIAKQSLQISHNQKNTYQTEQKVKTEKTEADKSQLKTFKIIYFPNQAKDGQKTKTYNILLIDYEQQEMENISKILLFGYCVFFPTLAMFCCIVCFKTYFQNLLIYYGVISVQPSFKYPLNKLALKIKLKELKSNGYAKIHKNKRKAHVTEDSLTTKDIKFSVQCCFCLEELKYNQEMVQLYCRHEFHSECFIEWVINQPNTKCPLCKRAFNKVALEQFKQNNSKDTPKKPVQYFYDQNENEQQSQPQSNQIEMLEFQS